MFLHPKNGGEYTGHQLLKNERFCLTAVTTGKNLIIRQNRYHNMDHQLTMSLQKLTFL
jgi:hypothetical protein